MPRPDRLFGATGAGGRQRLSALLSDKAGVVKAPYSVSTGVQKYSPVLIAPHRVVSLLSGIKPDFPRCFVRLNRRC